MELKIIVRPVMSLTLLGPTNAHQQTSARLCIVHVLNAGLPGCNTTSADKADLFL